MGTQTVFDHVKGFKLEGDKCVDLDECTWDIAECEEYSHYDLPCDQMCQKHSGWLLKFTIVSFPSQIFGILSFYEIIR